MGGILAALQPRGLVPAVTVTTENATAGGTLSGDCLSRFSPAYGKEGRWIDSFDLLTTNGRLLTCAPPPPGAPPSEWTLEQRVYHGVIGGLGYLGAVVTITYRVLSVGQTNGRIGVHTNVRRFRTFEDLAADLVPTTRRMVEERSDPRDADKLDSIWSAVHIGRDGVPSALLFTSIFTTTPERRRMLMHRPKLAVRILFEWLVRLRFLNGLLWRLSFRFGFSEGKEYVDDLEGFSFFMDGNARAKRIGKRLGFKMQTAQQTFVVPSDPRTARGWDQAKDDLVEWLEHANSIFAKYKVSPTLTDVLFLPRDSPFFLSASADQPGFAVSYAFETSSKARLARIEQAFRQLSDVLLEKFGGRVYLEDP